MNWVSKEFLLAVCGSFLIALIAVSWWRPLVQSPPPQTTENTNRAGETDKKSQAFDYARLRSYIDSTANYCTSDRPNAPSEWSKKFICESKITDAVIAVLTFFLAVFTFLLVWVGSKQERTTRRQMRAFVYLNGGSVYNVASPLAPLAIYKPTGAELVSPTEGPLAQLTIRNSGSTPAYNVVHWGNIFVSEFPLKGPLPPIQQVKKPVSSAIPPEGFNTKKRPNFLAPHARTNLRVEKRYGRHLGLRRNYLPGCISKKAEKPIPPFPQQHLRDHRR